MKIYMLRTHTCWELTAKHIGQEVLVMGRVNKIRNLGGMTFIDLRDRYGITQILSNNNDQDIKSEYVVKVTAKVVARPDNMINKDMITGEIELHPSNIEIISTCAELPFSIDHENAVGEEIRLQYRYLDLRRESARKMLEMRSKLSTETLNFFVKKDFLNIETPSLIKNTPEGSREYIVPSRQEPGNFYVLPQSPQQLKQMLMVAGVDKYIQIARCFRDEDPRGDRQPEFTQVDFEMSFVEEKDILDITQEYFIHISEKLYPNKKIKRTPFPHITRKDAMSKYGSDKPELRTKDLHIIDVNSRAHNTEFGVFKNAESVQCIVAPEEYSRWIIEKELEPVIKENGGKWLAYLILNEEWPRGGIAKFFTKEQIEQLKEITGAKTGETILFQASTRTETVELLWALRIKLLKKHNLLVWLEDELAFAFIVDFPLFELNDEWNLSAVHHAFTKPKDKYIPRIKELWVKLRAGEKITAEDKAKLLDIEADCYDIIVNGYELGGGSIRIHDRELQDAIFAILGITVQQTQERFGHLLKAFEYWVPPHGGCAFGFDRIVMIYQNMPNIREVIPFPKNQKMQDLMLHAPSAIDATLLDELQLKVIEK